MLPRISEEDCLAIFQRLAPVSFSRRAFRTCKWANQYIEDNKRKIKIHTDKNLNFHICGAPNLDDVLRIQSTEEVVLKEIPCEATELESILEETTIQYFAFARVSFFAKGWFNPDLYNRTIEVLATVAARKLEIAAPIETLPPLSYSYECVEVYFCEDRNIVSRCCEHIRKIAEGAVVAKRIMVRFPDYLANFEVLERFLEEKGSETVALAEGFEFRLIPVSQSSFLVVHWHSNGSIFRREHFDAGLITSSEKFLDRVFELYSTRDWPGDRLTADEVRHLPVVQQICNRFFP